MRASDEAAVVAERLRAAIAELELPVGGSLTASVGVCTGAAEQLPALVEHADIALYEAKAAGRNRVAVAARTGH